MIRPKHTKRDRNHAQIVQDLKALGMVVWDLADLGGHVLDILVFFRGKCLPVEIKSPGGELTASERASIEELRAVGVEAIVATCAEDVVEKWSKL